MAELFLLEFSDAVKKPISETPLVWAKVDT
jgi:hypothetical protein